MIDESTQTIAMQFLLAELDEDQTAAFLDEMARNEELRRFVAEAQETVTEMAISTTPKTPPPELWNRILPQIREG